jgi:alpha-amylase
LAVSQQSVTCLLSTETTVEGMTVRSKLFAQISAIAATVALTMTGLGAAQPASAVDFPTVVPAPAKVIDSTSVGMQMFMWNWNALKDECTNVLGPEGIDWILVMPPQEHVKGSAWWTHYQPVSYKLESNLGTELEFRQMVNACNTAGVKVIADAVINHMANGNGTGWDGQNYTKYNYPGYYDNSNFHSCKKNIQNYNDPADFQFCELGGLPDLATEQPAVRQTIANYLQYMADLGVSGFRIDAAKHIVQADLDAIKTLVNRPSLYWILEVAGGGSIAKDYSTSGDVWSWDSVIDFRTAFQFAGMVRVLADTSRYSAYTNQAVSVQMINNHDTERDGSSLSYVNGKLYQLADIALLGESWGKPMLYSGYAFNDRDQGPETLIGGSIKNPSCPLASSVKTTYKAQEFVCEQRWTAIKGMTAWHHTVGKAGRTSVFKSVRGVYGYGRNGKGYLFMNSQLKTYKATVTTGMAKGTYCDLITGGTNPIKVAGKSCVGKSIVVNSKKQVSNYSVGSLNAFAISVDSKLK